MIPHNILNTVTPEYALFKASPAVFISGIIICPPLYFLLAESAELCACLSVLCAWVVG